MDISNIFELMAIKNSLWKRFVGYLKERDLDEETLPKKLWLLYSAYNSEK